MDHGDEGPALQVIVLGSGGGPKEDNTTAFLVRSLATEWKRGSVLAVDAGVHLAAIARILGPYLPLPPTENSEEPNLAPFSKILSTGPFSGLEIPHVSAEANAAYITRTLIDTYLITHPHLDHISGFVVNTASLPGDRPKRLAGLPTTVNAFKAHIFNNVIWPNLSDENNGAGLVTYLRLVEGGSPAIGAGESKGYIEVCEGLSVKTWSVSHGHCMEKHSHRGSSAGIPSHPSPDAHNSPTSTMHSHAHMSPYSNPMNNVGFGHISPQSRIDERVCVYDSSAYFIRDIATGSEVLIFGDVEPDTISLSPRNLQVWYEAAPKIASGLLKAIFIECSYDDSRTEDQLFGHLAPRYVVEELMMLAEQVHHEKSYRDASTPTRNPIQSEDQFSAIIESRKRKRQGYFRTFSSSSRHTTASYVNRRDSEYSNASYPSRQRIGSISSITSQRQRSQTPEAHPNSRFNPIAAAQERERAASPRSSSRARAHLGPLQLEQYDLQAAQQRHNTSNSALHAQHQRSSSHSRSLVDRSVSSTSQESPTGTTEMAAFPNRTQNFIPRAPVDEPATTLTTATQHDEDSDMTPPATATSAVRGTDGPQDLHDHDEAATTTATSRTPVPAATYSSSSGEETGDPRIPTGQSAEAETEESMATTFLPKTDPLSGLKIIIIHVKDLLTDEKPSAQEVILKQLQDLAAREDVGLKCEFVVAESGMSFLF